MFKKIIKKAFNLLIIKKKRNIYVSPHDNCFNDKYDLINYTGDNSLCLVVKLLEIYSGKKIKVFLECHTDRFSEIYNFIELKNNKCVEIKLLRHSKLCKTKISTIKTKITNLLHQYSSRVWVSDTLSRDFSDKVFSQKVICANYSTPLKTGKFEKTHKTYSFLNYFIETSLLAGMVHSSEYKIGLEKITITGFPRNDNLLDQKKSKLVLEWIKNNSKCDFKHIFVYAPTYRDYSGAFSNDCLFGYDYDADKLEDFLIRNQILVIFKMHPLQELSNIKITNHILKYENTPLFSLYDLLSVSTCLISDYSSVIHDYLITNKPVIINCFDYERYNETRGFAFEPVSNALPATECNDINNLLAEMKNVSDGKFQPDAKYLHVASMFHKYFDSNSAQRLASLLESLLK